MTTPSGTFCPQCGTAITGQARFCPNCGADTSGARPFTTYAPPQPTMPPPLPRKGISMGARMGIGCLVFGVLGIVALGLGIAALASLAGDKAPAPAMVALGTPVTLIDDGWTITVTGVETHPTITSHTALGVYVAVRMTLANSGKDVHSLCGNRFTLHDDQGREFKYYDNGTLALGSGELCNKIGPGLSAPAAVVFDVPKDAAGLRLEGLGGFKVAIGDVATLP